LKDEPVIEEFRTFKYATMLFLIEAGNTASCLHTASSSAHSFSDGWIGLNNLSSL
jgi:hypothetical protein